MLLVTSKVVKAQRSLAREIPRSQAHGTIHGGLCEPTLLVGAPSQEQGMGLVSPMKAEETHPHFRAYLHHFPYRLVLQLE